MRQMSDDALLHHAVNGATYYTGMPGSSNEPLENAIARTLRRERRLNLVTQMLGSAHDIADVLTDVVRLMVDLVEADAGALPFVTIDAERLEYRHTCGLPDNLGLTAQPRGAGIAWQIIEDRLPILINGYHQYERAFAPLVEQDIRAVIGAPVFADERPIGVLVMYRIGRDLPFTSYELDLLTIVGRQIGLAIERAQRYQDAIEDAKRRVALFTVSQQIGATLDLPQLYRAIHQAVTQLIACDAFTLSLADNNADIAVEVFRAGAREHLEEAGSDDAITQVLESGQSLYITGGARHTRLLIALRRGGRTVGVMTAYVRAPHVYAGADLELLDQLATTAAIAIENARLFETARHEATVRTHLYHASQRLGALLEMSQIHEELYHATASLVVCDGFLVATRTQTHDMPEIIYRVGDISDEICIELVNRAIIHGESLRYEDERCGNSVLAALMRRGGNVVGAILVRSHAHQAYSDADQSALELLAATAAIAIDNARLFADTRRLATTDDLTGVWSRRSFFEHAARELQRSKRTARPLAALMVDADDFKAVNDSYGHAAGDQVLRNLADRCHGQLRIDDIVGRYGGEEFAIMLPETALEAAMGVAERLRAVVAATPFITDYGALTLTISIGVAVHYPGDETTLDALIDRADRAMYAAKRSGRNRVCIWRHRELERTTTGDEPPIAFDDASMLDYSQ